MIATDVRPDNHIWKSRRKILQKLKYATDHRPLKSRNSHREKIQNIAKAGELAVSMQNQKSLTSNYSPSF
jgi:hypothetical protein